MKSVLSSFRYLGLLRETIQFWQARKSFWLFSINIKLAFA